MSGRKHWRRNEEVVDDDCSSSKKKMRTGLDDVGLSPSVATPACITLAPVIRALITPASVMPASINPASVIPASIISALVMPDSVANCSESEDDGPSSRKKMRTGLDEGGLSPSVATPASIPLAPVMPALATSAPVMPYFAANRISKERARELAETGALLSKWRINTFRSRRPSSPDSSSESSIVGRLGNSIKPERITGAMFVLQDSTDSDDSRTYSPQPLVRYANSAGHNAEVSQDMDKVLNSFYGMRFNRSPDPANIIHDIRTETVIPTLAEFGDRRPKWNEFAEFADIISVAAEGTAAADAGVIDNKEKPSQERKVGKCERKPYRIKKV